LPAIETENEQTENELKENATREILSEGPSKQDEMICSDLNDAIISRIYVIVTDSNLN